MITPGTRLGAYEILEPLGAGGMGEVYRATDTNLKRAVAIKVLPSALSADSDRLARFQREAEVLAALNHPNIASIFGLEKSDGVTALVMELVEGETLAEIIAGSGPSGALPLGDALNIARQIAEALEAAHEQGIIHRDLKPTNVKVRPDGTVKVLDFGLAKILDPDRAEGRGQRAGVDLTASPTITTPAMTQAGIVLGTAAYMSPEQARGKVVDKRTDIWAFGCVLYEMLTGRRAFNGEDVLDVLGAVTRTEPDWAQLPESLSPSLRALVQRCLEKDRKQRVADISIARFVMNESAIASRSPDVSAARVRQRGLRGRNIAAAVAALVVTAFLGGGAAWFAMRGAPRRVIRSTIAPTGTSALSVGLPGGDVAISPAGTTIVYSGNGGTQLFVRSLDRLDAVPLTPPGRPSGFCFSPDGQWIAFVEDYMLKKVAITGGTAVALGGFAGGNVQGLTWGDNGDIVLATDANLTGLVRMSQDGGEAKVLTRPNRDRREVDHLWPEFLPGGEVVLFTITSADGADNAQVAVLNVRTGAVKVLLRGGSHARYVPSGHLVYGAAGSLRAVAFDVDTLDVSGASVAVLPQVLMTPSGSVDLDLASDGTLVYVAGGLPSSARSLVWVDRQGREEAIDTPLRTYQYPRISPDGSRVAIDIRDQENDIWILELARGALTRFTVDAALDRFPAWSHDGRDLFFASDRAGHAMIFRQAADGTGTPEQLTRDSTVENMPAAVSPDGDQLLFRHGLPQGFDLYLLALNGEHRTQPLLSSRFSEQNGEISPDGRWLAYQSNETGQLNVFVRPFPNVNGGRWQVSSDGGVQPLWAPDGHELFYFGPNGDLQAVGVQGGSIWEATKPSKVFGGGYVGSGTGEAFGRSYDISHDGRRFLMIKAAASPGRSETPVMIMIQNWFEELKRLVPAK